MKKFKKKQQNLDAHISILLRYTVKPIKQRFYPLSPAKD